MINLQLLVNDGLAFFDEMHNKEGFVEYYSSFH
jgi:hypothetical protein